MAAEREQGTATTYVVRYPDGSSEFRMGGLVLEIGDVLTSRGDRWLVADVAEDVGGTMTILLRRGAPEA